MTEPIAPPRPEPGPLRPGPAAPPDTGMGGGGFFQRRSMGIPNWGWIIGGVAGGLLLLWWFRHGKQPASEGGTGGTGTTTNQTPYSMDIVGAQSSVLAQLRDLQGQASTPGPAGPAGEQGPAGPAGPAGTPTPAATPTAPVPSGPDLSPKGQTVSVGTNANIYDFARSIYGSALGINTLRSLNPGFDSWLSWSTLSPDSTGNKQPSLIKGRPVRT
jgi:hypothetical protein